MYPEMDFDRQEKNCHALDKRLEAEVRRRLRGVARSSDEEAEEVLPPVPLKGLSAGVGVQVSSVGVDCDGRAYTPPRAPARRQARGYLARTRRRWIQFSQLSRDGDLLVVGIRHKASG